MGGSIQPTTRAAGGFSASPTPTPPPAEPPRSQGRGNQDCQSPGLSGGKLLLAGDEGYGALALPPTHSPVIGGGTDIALITSVRFMDYHHTQIGPVWFRFGVLVFLVALVVISAALGQWTAAVITAIVAIIVVTTVFVFSRFTVEVADDWLKASFGWGWPHRTVRWDEARTVRITRNRWWYGWGIRWFPGGTLWNVWGLDALEFDLVKGRKLRIGTDEPEQLLAALGSKVPSG